MVSPRPDNMLPELRKFLAAGQIRRHTGEEAREFLREVFEAVHREQARLLPPEDQPYRVMALYRIVRQLATMVGLIAHDETLEEGLGLPAPGFWTTQHPVVPPSPTSVPLAGSPSDLRKMWLEAVDDTPPLPSGVALLPPADYYAREKWCRVASATCDALQLQEFSIGAVGVFGLLTVDGSARCDVVGGELIGFELRMIDMVLELYLDRGERAVRRTLRDEYGISGREASGLIVLAKSRARKETQGSIEEKRAIHERRLEAYISRCKETLDMDGEMKALKELGKVQGLTRTTPEDRDRDFLDALRAVAQRQDEETLSALDRSLVQGRAQRTPRTIAIEAEALTEFDRERNA